jgi:hypothetical protein
VSSAKKVVLGSALLVLLFVGLGAAVFLYPAQSGLTTVTFDGIEWDREGKARVVYTTLADHGLQVETQHLIDGQSYNHGTHRLPPTAWPFARRVRTVCATSFDLNPDGSAEAATCRRRLLVELGRAYAVRAGERLSFYDFKSASGERHEGFIETKPLR